MSGRGQLTNSYKTCVLTRFVLKEGKESNSASASTDNRDLSKYLKEGQPSLGIVSCKGEGEL